ncbi:MAG: 30S ribosomal protein S8 [Oscillospiraceae bacterium]|jgi:small subunit ribosomal protein S8|nr:30S ribosomal protein S8 [Oscillospiraceae bacterium]
MQITDSIADFLTRIRNAGASKSDFVEIPSSKMKKAVAKILVDEGYIRKFTCFNDGKQGILRIILRYSENRIPVIRGLRRISKPGLRVYSGVEKLPKVMRGLGVAIVSTHKGIMTDRKARANRVGGEVLAYIW